MRSIRSFFDSGGLAQLSSLAALLWAVLLVTLPTDALPSHQATMRSVLDDSLWAALFATHGLLAILDKYVRSERLDILNRALGLSLWYATLVAIVVGYPWGNLAVAFIVSVSVIYMVTRKGHEHGS